MFDPSAFAGNTSTGAIGEDGLEELRKALTAGYGSDVSQLTGGGALRVQSLDMTMQATVQENKHFKLFNKLMKPKATATIDEWTEQSGVGGFLGGSTNSETGVINSATGTYARRVGQVKYLMTQRQVSLVVQTQNGIADAEAVEYNNGALQLLTDAEYLAFEGDSTVVPTEFDGIFAQMVAGVNQGQVDPGSVISLNGLALNSIEPMNAAAAQIAGFGNFGTPTDLYMSQLTQADFDSNLDPAFRVPLTDVPNGGITLGSPVRAIRTSHGDIASQNDIFVRDGNLMTPFELRYAAVSNAAAVNAQKPTNVTVAVAGNASSNFAVPQAGNYYWLVAGTTAAGQSTGFLTAQAAVAAGQAATLTITASAGGTETGYTIYRSRTNGTNALADMREMCRIPALPNTTTYVDINQAIPGTSKAFLLNLMTSATAINWRQYLPMIKFPLYPTNAAVIPWAQLLFGYLRISKRKHHVVFTNILPNKATWRPFNV